MTEIRLDYGVNPPELGRDGSSVCSANYSHKTPPYFLSITVNRISLDVQETIQQISHGAANLHRGIDYWFTSCTDKFHFLWTIRRNYERDSSESFRLTDSLGFSSKAYRSNWSHWDLTIWVTFVEIRGIVHFSLNCWTISQNCTFGWRSSFRKILHEAILNLPKFLHRLKGVTI